MPSLPSFVARLCFGDNVDSGSCGTRFCDCGCDCADEEDECGVCAARACLCFAGDGGAKRRAEEDVGRLGDVLMVALGDMGGGVVGLATENGRKGGESGSSPSSSSSEAEERDFMGGLEGGNRGLRGAKARLRDMGCGASGEEEEMLEMLLEEEEEEELAMADGLGSRSRERRWGWVEISVDRREVSRLRLAKDEGFSVVE